MTAEQTTILATGVFFIFIFLSGIWLNRSGKPYHTIKLNIHKFIGLGAVVFLARAVYQTHQAAPLSPGSMAASLVSAAFFVLTIVSGGLVSIDRPIPALLTLTHKLSPYLTALATAATLYLMLVH